MLSSVNSFGGLSSAELLTLFGWKSSSAGSDSRKPDQSASLGVSGASSNNPANAIQAILAQAQIDKADIEQALTGTSTSSLVSTTLGPGSGNPTTAIEEAPRAQAQMDSANRAQIEQASTGLDSANPAQSTTVSGTDVWTTAVSAQMQIDQAQSMTSWGSVSSATSETVNITRPGGPTLNTLLEQAQAEQTQAWQTLTQNSWGGSARTAYAAQTTEGSVTNFTDETAAMTAGPDLAGQEEWASSLSSISATSVSLAPTSDEKGGAGPVDSFQLSATLDNQTFSFGFTVKGLGPVKQIDPNSGGVDYSVGQGTLKDFFQISLNVDGFSGGLAFNVSGLDAAQAREVAAAFGAATAAPTNIGTALNTGYTYDRTYIPATGHQHTSSYNPGVSISFDETVGY